MNKDKLETICRAAHMRPEHREHFNNHDIFVADGFSLPPHAAHRRFGIAADEFPHGMYATLWWVGRENEKLDIGQALYFEKSTTKQGRINAAVKEARELIVRREKASTIVH